MDLAKNLGFTIETSTAKNVLSQRQIELAKEARKQIKDYPDSFLDWHQVHKALENK